ncbi:aminopeptidase N [Modestobacter sp. I12A-02628]|uniref:Aminopeptidase N n=1 Tax=Goekera deserti TaxID=2497753 RepID=A0A7K3WCU1_9ACTN|nr:aminopeptidase N [Goekera deserti]MPQ97378.1 aminopeptidase N [Goekera deserti]NDI48021.1 aminopeptidase N [Goekera deserti]NEL53769.1 aminopeptidase N [Goekera deserti]
MAVPNLTRDEAAARAQLLAVHSYDLQLDVTDGAGRAGVDTFRSTTTVQFQARTPGADTFIDLVADRVLSATLNGRELDVGTYTEEHGLPLPGLADLNELVVTADCRYSRTGEGLHRFHDPEDDQVYLYSHFEPAEAKRMFACFDQPDLKAVFTVHVTAPFDWQVVSNTGGRTIEAGTAGAQLVHFEPTKRISTYLVALVAGPYAKVTDLHDGIPLGIYCRASLAQHLDPEEIFAVTKQGFDFYHRVFEYPYPFDKYDQLFVPEFNAGAMENAGAVTFLEDYVFRSRSSRARYERRAETILHELAHMWFGDLVTMRWWDDLWLNESFATYISTLCQAEATEYTTAWTTFANTEKSWAYAQDQLPSTHPIAADMVDVAAVEVNFDGITYAKGASVLKQLVAYVGREEFLAGVRRYFRKHEYGNTTLADLLGPLSESTGRDLSEWSAQWLQTSQVNTLRPVSTLDDDGRYRSFAIEQTAVPAHPVLRAHRLAVGLYTSGPDGLTRTHRVELDVSGERTEVPELAGHPAADLVLVNDDDLTYAKLRLDERSLATLRARIGEIPDSLPRALCWSAAWDMTRDGELPARDWVQLVLAGIDAESEVSVVQSLLARVQSALSSYADPAWAPTGWTMLADKALAALRAAEPGTDTQLQWSRTFAGAARTAEHADVLRGLLDGSTELPGLTVDADARWAFLQGLVAIGEAGDAEIDAEAARDATATGVRRTATSRALRPTAESKADTWQRAFHDESIANSTHEAMVAGFWHPAQRELTASYVDRFFADVRPLWDRRPGEIAKNAVQYLFPPVVDPHTVDAADAWLADPSHPAPLRRLVSEGRDGILRSLFARRRDAAAG